MMLLFVTAQSRRHDTRPSQVAHDLLWIVTPHDRQAADIVMHHSGYSVVKNLVRKSDDWMPAAGLDTVQPFGFFRLRE
jgi:hypothetical protein